ncbi:MAG: flagellin lysine-N-methylase [Butyrivibrio sp.]|nr:flagellin lysine-N-methylase [Butyrivibrio sp.]
MLYRKQSDYDNFKCIADKCPMSCCIGWQIVIDDDSLNNYAKITQNDKSAFSSFKDQIIDGVDFKEGCFFQNNRRCSMLQDDNLCSMQISLGEEALCTTCKQFPRHIEEFQDIREYSLSLSCPEAINMLLTRSTPLYFIEEEDSIQDDPEEFDDYDLLLFDKLEFAREKLLGLASDPFIPFQKRLDLINEMAARLQICYDNGEFLEMDDIVYDYPKDDLSYLDEFNLPKYYQPSSSHNNDLDNTSSDNEKLWKYNLDALKVLSRLEKLETDWSETINDTISFIEKSKDNFEKALYEGDVDSKAVLFENTAAETDQNIYDNTKIFAYRQILTSLLFTYFCGAVYDGQIFARACICTQTIRFIMMIYEAKENPKAGIDLRVLSKIVYLYSREIEHSDLNMNELIEWFSSQI